MTDKKSKIIIIIACVIALITVILFAFSSSPYIFGKEEIHLKKEIITEEKISINDADKLELMRIPDVGEKTAESIIAYREENGEFKSLDELMNIKGIGEKTYQRLLPFLTIKE